MVVLALAALAANGGRLAGREVDAERLDVHLGWQLGGTVPGHARLPRGGLSSTSIFYRTLPGGP
jgi:hypothetical protein